MKPSEKLVGGAVLGVLALIGIEMNASAAPPVTAGSAPVTVVNTTPVPVTGTITGQITGQVSINNQPTVNAVQSGPWNVNAGGQALDNINGRLSNIQTSVGQFQFDQTGSLFTTLRGPVQMAGAVVSKKFRADLRINPLTASDEVPIIIGGAPTTINMTMFVLRSGHDDVSVYVRGPFQTGGTPDDSVPILTGSQSTIVTFPTAIPVSSFFTLCDNLFEHCDVVADVVGY